VIRGEFNRLILEARRDAHAPQPIPAEGRPLRVAGYHGAVRSAA
ncbi:Crp/Fnr family transcriptional regulator, partial [Burkholderia pseudomallei]